MQTRRNRNILDMHQPCEKQDRREEHQAKYLIVIHTRILYKKQNSMRKK